MVYAGGHAPFQVVVVQWLLQASGLAKSTSGASEQRGPLSVFPFRTKQGKPLQSAKGVPDGATAKVSGAGAGDGGGSDASAAAGAAHAAAPGDEGVHAPFEMERLPARAQLDRARLYREFMDMRRSVRFFSPERVDRAVVEECIRCAGTAPSGAHTQPWRFVLVQTPSVKAAVRAAVEAEEQINYDRRMKKTWVRDVNTLVSQVHADGAVRKPYLEVAPYLIVVMKVTHEIDAEGKRVGDVYYPVESTGIATGMLISALHNANLVTLTSTPMGAETTIRRILGRPDNEKVFVLMPVGYPAKDATVPYRDAAAWRKPLADIMPVV